MSISCYADLLAEARRQPEPQRLLFVFTRAELPDNPSKAQRMRFEQGQGGVLTPVLCVDKLPEELSDMASLSEESRRTGVDWDVVFVAALAGEGGKPPASEDAEKALQHMIEAIQMGSVDNFLTFNRDGEAINFH